MNVLREKSFAFSGAIVGAYKELKAEKKEFVMSKQLLRAGTSIGAIYREAEYAQSKSDFIHKLSLAQKECNETLYWLELLHQHEYLEEKDFNTLHEDGTELLKLLTSIIKSSKKRL